MFIKKASILIVVSVIIFSFLGCGSKKDIQFLPGIPISQEKMNTNIALSIATEARNSFQNGIHLELTVTNLSNQSIVFPSDYGIAIFTKDGENWVRVTNNFSYAEGENILPPDKEYPGGIRLSLIPYVQNPHQYPLVVRVVITGHVIDKPTEVIGAFLDVKLKPYVQNQN